MKSVKLAPAAEGDLEDIWLYIAADNIDAADETVERIVDSAMRLGQMPHVGRLRDEVAPN